MVKKYCIDCGSPFEYDASISSESVCEKCKGETVTPLQAHFQSPQTPQQLGGNGLNKSILNINPNYTTSNQSQPLDLNNLKNSFGQDIVQTKGNSSSLKPQVFKAEDVIASASDPNFKRYQRPSSLGSQSALDKLKEVGKNSNIDLDNKN